MSNIFIFCILIEILSQKTTLLTKEQSHIDTDGYMLATLALQIVANL